MTRINQLSFLILAVLLAGCLPSQQVMRKIDYYTLEYAPPQGVSCTRAPIVLKVARFTAAPMYTSDKIVYRSKKFTRATYTYHRWRALANDMVTYFLARDLQASGCYQAVFAVNSAIPPSYTIEGTVDEFYEQDASDTWEAILAVSITLIDPGEPDISKKIIFQKGYRANAPCEQKNPRSLAAAMSAAMAQISEKTQLDISQYLKSR